MSDPLVLITDFGARERFVASMKGVAVSIDPDIRIYDLTHEIEPFNILEAAVTLVDTIEYWPKQTVFVAVVDPGVGTTRKSLAVLTSSGHYVLCPDNGLLTFVDDWIGIEEVINIAEDSQRISGSNHYHTFHGRDIYAYNAARLAGLKVRFQELGSTRSGSIVKLERKMPARKAQTISGTVIKTERPFGNIGTDIPKEMLDQCGINVGTKLRIRVLHGGQSLFASNVRMVCTYGDVELGTCLAHLDSNGRLGLAMNGQNMAEEFAINAGLDQCIEITVP